ncbi:MAG: hypothetical protein RIQ93_3230 [Verrucomicrobiota bacterium]
MAAASEPISPQAPIILFNGKDLSNFTTWEIAHKLENPDKVFSVVDQIDGAPAIRISGQHYGGILTRERYANYRLVSEFRWGLLTWAPRTDKTRDSGILLHCQGEEGNMKADFSSPWLRSVEAQIIEGGTGDVLILPGYDRGNPTPWGPTLKMHAKEGPKRGSNVWDPTAPLREFKGGRIDWQFRDPEWKDVLGFRGRQDVEKPAGEWNVFEIIAEGGDLTYILNGVKVNEGKDGSFKEGRILFQSEGAEIYFRRIELHPIKK